MRWLMADGDVLAFVRESPEESLLVVAMRADSRVALRARIGRCRQCLAGVRSRVRVGGFCCVRAAELELRAPALGVAAARDRRSRLTVLPAPTVPGCFF